MQQPPESTCPAAGDLALYLASRLPEADRMAVAAHLERCTRCPEIVRNLQEADTANGMIGVAAQSSPARLREARAAGEQPARRFRELLSRPRPDHLRFGQCWTVAAPGNPPDDECAAEARIVVLLAGDPAAAVATAPISLALPYCSPDDLLVRADEGPLGYAFMIEAWNTVTVLRDQLARYAGTLQQPVKRFLGLLCQSQLGLPVDLSELETRRGPAILESSDPRLRFQEQEILACAHLRRPALRALEAPVAAPAAPEAHPFAGIVAEGKARGLTLHQIAERLGLTPALVRRLDLRAFRFGPRERPVAAAIGSLLGWDLAALAHYLQQRPALAPNASFRADRAPETQEQQDFFEAVRADPRLTDEQRSRWLRLMDPGEQEVPPT